ncbi:hypothetical protein Psta_0116 [Pirellula staleyi DSM 6068]|uniref:Uncharacterized protein n=1 Tax=Pirellula staleyi (strain ATCC 27377 / DSM 6068 / ICPB 4128) TaxID=530564 RepID=D2R0E4_PIRSD|nr:Minf_1886 family protein [Pirellula staleyi]ADB14812.1 hypothetical protein Psta_0116 [Pirellula staleyi DSM 6068]
MSQEIHPLVKLLCEDTRYKLEAYQFVRAGLKYAQDELGLGADEPSSEEEEAEAGTEPTLFQRGPVRHVTGQDLSRALKTFAHSQYGYMARLVLASWGIKSTSDFGEIVYNLIKIGEMTKSAHDRREDFDDVYDFQQALEEEFEITRTAEE